jgi:hypothetical protein
LYTLSVRRARLYSKLEFVAEDGQSSDFLYTDYGPYGKMSGLLKLSPSTSFENITPEEVEALEGKFTDQVSFEKGDLIAVIQKNYFTRTVFVIRIDDRVNHLSVNLTVRYLKLQKAPYYGKEPAPRHMTWSKLVM